MRYALALVMLLALPVAAADLPPRVTDIVVAFGELQHVADTYSHLSTCTIPGLNESCTVLLSPQNLRMITTEVAGFNAELMKFPSAWQSTAIAILERIGNQLDDAGRARLQHYLALVKAIIVGP